MAMPLAPQLPNQSLPVSTHTALSSTGSFEQSFLSIALSPYRCAALYHRAKIPIATENDQVDISREARVVHHLGVNRGKPFATAPSSSEVNLKRSRLRDVRAMCAAAVRRKPAAGVVKYGPPSWPPVAVR